MALDQIQNFINVRISGTHTSADTTIQLESGEAGELPDPNNGEYNLVWFNEEEKAPDLDPEVEIVRVTGVDTNNDTVTVQRGQESTTAVDHNTSGAVYRFILSPTAKLVNDIDSANFATNSISLTGGNGIDSIGSISLGGSATVAISTDGIGTDELDESANFSFSNLGATTVTGDLDMSNNNIDDVASIDGGGNAVQINDNLDFNNNLISGLDRIIADDSNSFDITVNNTGGIDFSIATSGEVRLTPAGTDVAYFTTGGNMNLVNSGSIQDAGTPAIQFDGSANVTIPNNLDVTSNITVETQSSLKFDASGVTKGLISNNGTDFIFRSQDSSNLDIFTDNSSGSNIQRLSVTGGVDTATLNLFNTNLDLNGGNINDSTGNLRLTASGDLDIDVGSGQILKAGSGNVSSPAYSFDIQPETGMARTGGKLTLADNGNEVAIANTENGMNFAGSTTQPGTSSTPAIAIGDSGAGFFINASGEVVVVDEAGNTTTIS